jgi:DegV family protein with EDD domain
MGIKPEALPHLFDTFQRVDEEKNRYIEGTGLGLSIVKQLVELMDGTITVNSVYGQGSVFTVAIKQGVSSEKRIGDISITNAGGVGANEKFEHIFHAPTARILIVDDNEMNLQVEKKLLDGTDITVDLAMSGVEALAMTVRNHYDVIFMDHLMPEMDGLECYEKIREQSGGLNKNVPIIVLTANAGGENIDLYNNTGFDGYLVKPVSGKQLENMLINHLPPEKIIRNSDSEMTGSQMNTASGYSRKRAVAIGCSTMADIPAEIKEELQIASVPFNVITSEGVFDDNVDIDSDELVRYMEDKEKYVSSDAPSEEELTKFFASQLKFAHQLIYITLATGASVEYTRATNVAKSFENVTVVNSACLSTATGILAMIAGRLAKQNMPVEKIVAEIENAKTMVQCTFIIKSTDVMARRGNISSLANNVLNLFWLRPVIHVKNNKMGVARFFFGNEKKCYENYIKTTLSNVSKIDTTFAFVTSVGMTEEELLWIEKEIRDKVSFEHIIFQKASAGIASNCGAGTFGILYLNKGNVNYNLGTIFKYDELDEQSDEDLYDSDEEYETADTMIFESEQADSDIKEETTAEKEWYEEIPGLDPKAGIKNSGSKDAFLSVLKIYYDSYDAKSGEIKSYYENEDWENYTIKVHALKSSSRLIGCLELGNNAEALEMAGKNNDIDFIRTNHDNLMNEYKTIRDELASEYGGVSDDLPDIPDDVLADAYGGLMEFAGAGDYELTRMILDSVKEYKLKDEDKEVFDKVNVLLSNLDWDGIKETVQARM